jgi:thymidylate synthase
MPCTALWQFHLRDELLSMTAVMRSWDLVWGLSFDVPSFVAVQLALADHLGVGIGRYVHVAGSAHVYDRHYDVETWPRDDVLTLDYLGGSVQQTRANALREMGVT